MRRILFANGRRLPPFFIGGDGVSSKTWLDYLADNNFECLAFGISNPWFLPELSDKEIILRLKRHNIKYRRRIKLLSSRVYLNRLHLRLNINKQLYYQTKYSSIMVKREFFTEELERLIKNFRPNLILTQLNSSKMVLKIANIYKIPALLFIHDVHPDSLIRIREVNKYDNSSVVFVSEFTQKYFEKYLKRPCFVSYPPLKIKDYLVKKNSRQFITMINPIKSKGGKTFEKIVKNLTWCSFLAVRHWRDPLEDGINLKPYSNVKIMDRQDDMKKVYSQTNILLLPSTCQEGCPRVVIEAELNGIPVIASDRGGVREAVGKGGILIKEFGNIKKWVKAIEKLMREKDYYQKLSRGAQRHARKFSSQVIMKKFTKIINRMIKEPKQQ